MAFLVFFMAFQNVYGAMFERLEIPADARVGFFVSTFDPITHDNERVIADALKSGEIDYLFVIPTDFTPHKLARQSMYHRQEMLKVLYGAHPKVVVTESNYRYGFPQSRNIVEKVKALNLTVSTVGVVLQGDMSGSWIKRRIARWLTPVERWLVLSPFEEGVGELSSYGFGGRPLSYVKSISPRSSSRARRFLLGNESFFSGKSASQEELAVSLPVQRYIRRHRLYFAQASRCEIFSDFERSI